MRPGCSGGRIASDASRPGYDADIVLLDAPDWRHVAYHLAGRDIAAVYAHGVRIAGRAAEPRW